MQSNLMSIHDAKNAFEEKKETLLSLLSKFKYISSKQCKYLFDYKGDKSAQNYLKRLAKHGLIQKHTYMDNRVVLWGITHQGLIEYFDGNVPDHYRAFEPKKLSISTLEHNLMVNSIAIKSNKIGLNYLTPKDIGSRSNRDKVPDGIIKTPRGNLAIEVEFTVKSKQRIDTIIYHYLKLIKRQEISRVLYIMPTEAKRTQVKNVFHSLKAITMIADHQKTSLKINPEVHLSFFDFLSYDKVDSYLERLA